MFRATLKGLLSRKIRLILSAMAVVLGVMFVSGAFVLTDTLGRGFDAMFATVTANVDVQVSGQETLAAGQGGEAAKATIPASVLEKVRATAGVDKATGQIFRNGALVVGKDGKVLTSIGPPQAGSSWAGEDGLRELRDGNGPVADDEVAIDAATAKTADYKVGDTIKLLTPFNRKATPYKLTGIYGYVGGRDTLGGAQIVAFTLPKAQEVMLGEKDAFTEISVEGRGDVSQEELRDNVKAALGGAYVVETQAEVAKNQASDVKEGLAFFNYILLGFAGVALFVGIFLILNTFSMLVAQRTRELALFRAIGASRKQVIGSVMLEATIIGLIASVLGLLAGVGVGAALAWAFSTFGGNDLDLTIGVPLAAVIAAFVVGLGVTLVAALLPAIRASRIPPVAAMRDAATPDKPLTLLTVLGSAFLTGGAIALAAGLNGAGNGTTTLWLILVGVLVAFIGVALLTPIISRPIVSVLGRLFAWSVPGKLGRQNSARNPRRTAITAAALMVSIALVTGVSTVLASATKSIGKSVTETLQADLIISGVQTGPIAPTFDKNVVAEAAQVKGVKAIGAFWFAPAKVNGDTAFVSAINDLTTVGDVLGLKRISGDVGDLRDNTFVLDDQSAEEKNLKVGSTVEIQLPKGGPQQYTLAGIYGRQPGLAGYLMPQSITSSLQTDGVNIGFVQLDDGTKVSDVQDELKGLVADNPLVSVQDGTAYVESQTAGFDGILKMIQILLGLALIIAILGIINTLALSVIERTRELGLLRAIGLRRSQTMRMITVESVVISVFGALLGLAVGVGLGAAVVKALEDQGFTDIALPWGLMATYLIGAGFVGVIAAILPAIRAAKLNVLNAIAYE